jgi:AraC-like DNA-binding protein
MSTRVRHGAAGRGIRTYSLAERSLAPGFAIHDETATSRIGAAHRHEYFQLQLNLAGHASQHIGATVRALPPGGLSFVLPYRVHRVVRPAGSRFYVINFEPRYLRPELDVDPLDLEDMPPERAPELAPFLYQAFMDFRLSGPALAQARAACADMLEESRGERVCRDEVIRARMLLLLALVCRSHADTLAQVAATRPQRRSRRDALARVVRYCRDRLGERITLADAAAAADLSPTYLAHLLKKETGKSFVDLVTERRMERARELLAHTPDRVGAIAAAVGYDDEAYFARRFRQYVGRSPRAYRLAFQSGEAATQRKNVQEKRRFVPG